MISNQESSIPQTGNLARDIHASLLAADTEYQSAYINDQLIRGGTWIEESQASERLSEAKKADEILAEVFDAIPVKSLKRAVKEIKGIPKKQRTLEDKYFLEDARFTMSALDATNSEPEPTL